MKINSMKSFKIILFLLAYCHLACSQNSIEIAQGVWEEDVEGFDSYIVVENSQWYSITILDGNTDVSKELFGFYDDFDADSINPKDLSKSGRYIVFLMPRSSIKDYNTYLKRGYYNFYEYDLDENYFIYYANNPVTLNKIDALPKDVQKVFEKKKDELDKIKFLENQQ